MRVVFLCKNVGESSTAENYHPISLLSMISKVFEKLVYYRIVDHQDKCSLFSDFQYSSRSFRSTEDLLTVASDRIARVFDRSGATPAVALDISEAFNRVWHAGLLHAGIPKSYGISIQKSGLILSFLSSRQLQVVLDGKSSQEYLVNAGIPQARFLVLHFFYYTLMTFLMMLSVILSYMLMILLSILSVIRHLVCDLRQELELTSELESDVWNTMDWNRKWLVDFEQVHLVATWNW